MLTARDKTDLIKAETPHLGPRIQLMLSQLEFKLSVEKQYKDGIEKMVRLYQLEGDRKSRAEAEGRRIESSQKIQLLKQALKRHEDLHVDIGAEMQDDDSLNMPSQRKPLSGHLSIRVQAVADVDHAATGRFSRGPETFVMIKVEDAFKGRTKATRTDRWIDEQHDFDIDKANEIELTVYDKAGEHPLPVGMLWIRISDIAEEMRRKRIESEFKNSGWMSADHMGEGGPRPDAAPQFQPPPGSAGGGAGAGGLNAPGGGLDQGGPVPQTSPMVVDNWFSLEPVGKIKLSLTFGKQRDVHVTTHTASASYNTNMAQSSKTTSAGRSMSDSAERVLSVSEKRRLSSSTGTSLSSRHSTTSCAAPSAAISSNTRQACSVPTADSPVTKSVTPVSSPNVLASQMLSQTRTKKRSTTASPTDSSPFPIWAPTGAVIAVTC